MNAPSAMPADPPPANGTAVGPAAQPDPTAFPSIPGFTIIAELGRGGAGVVYEALLLSLNRQVALKSIWDVDTRRQVCSIAAPGHAISDIALHPNGRWLATATREPTVCLWDLSSAEIAQSQVAANAVRIDCWKGQAGFLAGVCVHPDGRLLSLETDGKMHTWSAPAPSTSGDPPDGNGVGMALGYRPDGTLMAAARMAEGVVLWEAGSGRVLLKLDTTKTERIAGEFCFSSDGRRVAAGAADGCVRVWDASDGTVLMRFPTHSGHIESVCLTPDGRRLGCMTQDGLVQVWSLAEPRKLTEFRPPAPRYRAVRFTPDGRFLVSRRPDDPKVEIWDVDAGCCVHVLQGHRSGVTDLAFSPDRRRIASVGFDHSVRLWDVASGQQVLAISNLGDGSDFSRNLAFRPDGQQLAVIRMSGRARSGMRRDAANEQEGRGIATRTLQHLTERLPVVVDTIGPFFPPARRFTDTSLATALRSFERRCGFQCDWTRPKAIPNPT